MKIQTSDRIKVWLLKTDYHIWCLVSS